MDAKELRRKLKKLGCTFETKGSGHGHIIVRAPNGRKSELPMHGKGKELGTGLVRAIYKQLDLTP